MEYTASAASLFVHNVTGQSEALQLRISYSSNFSASVAENDCLNEPGKTRFESSRLSGKPPVSVGAGMKATFFSQRILVSQLKRGSSL